jgi:hypothetical protein
VRSASGPSTVTSVSASATVTSTVRSASGPSTVTSVSASPTATSSK